MAALQHWADAHLDAPLGDLAAALLLDVVLAEIGPSIYSRQAGTVTRALADAQRHLAPRPADLDIGVTPFPGPDSSGWRTQPRRPAESVSLIAIPETPHALRVHRQRPAS